MVLGAREMWNAKGGYTAKSYVQDGLIAMWDGIENAGWGVHDDNVTNWVSLVGNYTATKRGNISYNANSVVFPQGAGNYFSTNTNFGRPSDYTFEICFKRTSDAALYSSLFSAVEGGGTGWQASSKDWFTIGKPGGGYYPNLIGTDFDIGTKKTLTGIASTIDGKMLVYVDKTLFDYRDDYVGTRWGGYNFNIGVDAGDERSQNFVGNFYSIRVYSRALTAAEIAANYAVDAARFNLPTT